MAVNYYTLNYASTGDVGGKTSIKILPTDIDMSTTLTLPGQGRVNYGEFFDTNILQMLEHFAKKSPPYFPTVGQLWLDMNTYNLRCYVKNAIPNNLDASTKNSGWIYLMSMTGTQPTTPYSGQMWYDQGADVVKFWNTGQRVWNTITTQQWVAANFVSKAGDTMTGVLRMSSKNISDVLDPVAAQDAATKHYVDNKFVSKTGDTMTGVLRMSSKNISDVLNPVAAQDAATKHYVDNKFVSKAGDTMTGVLRMSSKNISDVLNPVAAQDAATKSYTDTAISTAIGQMTTFPKGGIIMWSGSFDTIPTGWVLCDGTKGTPDLTDRFVVGAGVSYGPGGTGGTATPDLSFTTDDHTLTIAEMPAHTHPGATSYRFADGRYGPDALNCASVGTTGAAGGGLGHSHTGKINASVVLPPYYALAFIMKS